MKFVTALAAAISVSAITPAFAQDAASKAEPTPAVTVSGSATIASD
jgi:hypothetical protein